MPQECHINIFSFFLFLQKQKNIKIINLIIYNKRRLLNPDDKY